MKLHLAQRARLALAMFGDSRRAQLAVQDAGLAPAPLVSGRNALFEHTAHDYMMQAITSIPDPDMVLRKVGISRHQLVQLTYDDEIDGAMETRREAACGTPWHLERPGEEGSSDPDPDDLWIEKMIERVWEPFAHAVWKCSPFGYSVTEIIYSQEEDGSIGLSEASEKPMQWFRPRPDGTCQYLAPGAAFTSAGGTPIDMTLKFYLARNRPTYANPYGEAFLSRLYWPWFFRHNAWRYWMQFLERFTEPFLVGTAEAPAKLIDELVKIGFENVVAVGSKDKMEAVTQGFAGEFEKAEIALTKRVQKIILGQTLTTDQASGGSKALGMVHDQVRQDRRRADIRYLVAAGQWLVNALFALNFPDKEPAQFCMGDEKGLQEERAARDKLLLDGGALKFKEQYLLRAYDFEAGDFEIPEPPPALVPGAVPGADPNAPPGSAKADNPANPKDTPPAKAATTEGLLLQVLDQLKARAHPQFTPEQQSVENLIGRLSQQVALPIPMERIAAAVRAATSPADLERRLAIVLDDADLLTFRLVLERALFAADVMGYAHAAEATGVLAPPKKAEPATFNVRLEAEPRAKRTTVTKTGPDTFIIEHDQGEPK
jgi:phage gp29-like protein